jgi:hypothetical protein
MKVEKTIRLLMCAIVAAAGMCGAASWAQNYPVKPVRYVIPFAAGTGNDIVGRLITDRLTRLWSQQVIVDNRAGASGSIGAAFVAKSPPDGYTLLHCNIAPNAISLSMIANIPYQHKDFAPITRIGMPYQRYCRAPVRAVQIDQGAPGLCKVQPGQAKLRLRDGRHLAAPDDGVAQVANEV